MSECKFAVEAFHAYIESIGLSRPAGTLGELKAFKAGAEWQLSLAQAELAALKADRDDQYNMKVKAREQRDKVTELLKAKAAVPNAERCEYCDGTGDVHRADGEWLGECTQCDAAPAQPQSDADIVPREVLRAVIAELVAALEGLLCASGSHSCSTLHHSKADQHKHDEPCKPRIRYELSLDNARATLAKHRGE